MIYPHVLKAPAPSAIQMRVLVLVAALITAGCQSTAAREPSRTHPGHEQTLVVAGQRNADGQLIICFVSGFNDTRIPVPLQGEYGFMIFSSANEELSEPRYLLACDRDSTVEHFRNTAAFVEAIQSLPAGSILSLHNTCQAGTFSDIGPAVLEDIKKRCTRHRIAFDEAPFLACTCQ